MTLSDNTCRGFCMTYAQWGQPLTFTGKYTDGFPEVIVYNGSGFCGITNNTVVDIDMHEFSSTMTAKGGLIGIVNRGTVRIRNFLFNNPDDIDFNKCVRPTKKGFWKVQRKRTKKSVGIITLSVANHTEINLF